MPDPNYAAIVFDLDGTLLDTLEDLADSMNAVLEALGYPTHALDKYRYFVGEGMEVLVKRALPDDRSSSSDISDAVKRLRQEYGQRWSHKSHPYPGISITLAELDRLQLCLAVLSNKAHEFTTKIVKHFFPATRFISVLGARRSVPKKPDPAGAFETAEALGVAPERFLYLGDTPTDMKTAISAGMVPVGVSWGFRPREELIANGAAHIIDHPQSLLELIRS